MQSSPPKKRESGALKEVWQAYNSLLEYTRSIAVMQSGNRGVRVSRTSNGTLLSVEIAPGEEAVAGEVVRMRVDTIFDDYLSCTRLDDNSSIAVAKPFNLRRTGWHGQTITYTLEGYPGAPATIDVVYDYISSTYRTAAVGAYTEHQVIRPQYKTGFSHIFAAQCENSGVSSASEWIDLNADGRAWTMVL